MWQKQYTKIIWLNHNTIIIFYFREKKSQGHIPIFLFFHFYLVLHGPLATTYIFPYFLFYLVLHGPLATTWLFIYLSIKRFRPPGPKDKKYMSEKVTASWGGSEISKDYTMTRLLTQPKSVSEFLKGRYKLAPFLTSLPIRHYFYWKCILSYKYELTIQIN